MLILSRLPQERILIDGGRITVTVLDAVGERVRLGIEAPTEMPVDREEVHFKRQEKRNDDKGQGEPV